MFISHFAKGFLAEASKRPPQATRSPGPPTGHSPLPPAAPSAGQAVFRECYDWKLRKKHLWFSLFITQKSKCFFFHSPKMTWQNKWLKITRFLNRAEVVSIVLSYPRSVVPSFRCSLVPLSNHYVVISITLFQFFCCSLIHSFLQSINHNHHQQHHHHHHHHHH